MNKEDFDTYKLGFTLARRPLRNNKDEIQSHLTGEKLATKMNDFVQDVYELARSRDELLKAFKDYMRVTRDGAVFTVDHAVPAKEVIKRAEALKDK